MLRSKKKVQMVPGNATTRAGIRPLILPFSLLAIAIVVTGLGGIIYTAHQLKEKEVARLQAIADLKAGQVSAWLEERLAGARALRNDDSLAELYQRWRSVADQSSRARLLQRLGGYRSTYSYRSVLLLDDRGEVLLAVGNATQPVAPLLRTTARRALAEGRVLNTGLYRSKGPQTARIFLDLVVPLPAVSGQPRLVVALQIDPKNFLYPYIQSWPFPSKSAETLLFRRDGDQVLFLNELRHYPDAALTLRIPMEKTKLLAVQILQGKANLGSVVDGVDYRYVPVMGVARAIPGTDWFLVAKLDKSELYAPAKRDVVWIALVDILALFAAAAAVILLHQRRELQFSLIQRHEQAEKLRALQLLDAIADGSTDAIYVKDEAGRYLLINREASRLTNKSRETVLGQNDTALFPAAEAEAIMAGDRRVMAENQVKTYEEILTTVDGVYTFLSTKGPLHDDAGNVVGLFGIARDITERKRAEVEKEISIEFLRLVNESRSTGELIRAATTFFQQRSGCEAVGIRLREEDDYPYFEARGFTAEFILAENSLCLRNEAGRVIRDSSGYPIMECMCGNVICSRFDPSKSFFTARGSFWTNSTTELLATTSEADRQDRTRNRCNGEGYESVVLIAIRSGEECLGLFQLNDRRRGLFSLEAIAMWERLTDYLAVALAKFRTKEALRESEQRYHSLFENMQEGFAYCKMLYDDQNRPLDFVYLDVNGAFERLTGLKDVVGKQVTEVIPGIKELSPELFEIYGRVALTGRPEKFEFDFKSFAQWLSISVYSPGNGYFVAVFNNITESKRAEAELYEKNAEMERFTYMISHDLKSPLVTVKTFLAYLEQDISQSDAGRIDKDMLYMRTAADKMGQMLDELLEVSRIGRVVNPPISVTFRELVEEALSMVAGPVAERGVAVQVDDEAFTLSGDRPRLVEIWQNLLENAVKFMGDQPSPRVEIGVQLRGRETVFFVRDNGMGVDMRYSEKVFGLFEKLDPRSGGTGLGLALVKRIVELYQGTIWLESEGFGQGACFRFTLPAAMQGNVKGDKS